MAADAATLAREAACYCYTPEQARAVLIYLLAQNAGNTSTPSELAATAACYCYGDKRTQDSIVSYLLTLLNAAACTSLSGAGDPTGVTTPEFSGQLYHDTDADTYYRSTGLTSADWTAISGGVCENLEGAGAPT